MRFYLHTSPCPHPAVAQYAECLCLCNQRLAQRLAEGLDIRFNHVVDKIKYGSNGVTCTCSNGATFRADAVIVSVSVGVLKVHPHVA